MPVVRLMKGRRITRLAAADSWKIGVDAGRRDRAGVARRANTARARRAATMAASDRLLRPSRLVAFGRSPLRGVRCALPDVSPSHSLPLANPLRC